MAKKKAVSKQEPPTKAGTLRIECAAASDAKTISTWLEDAWAGSYTNLTTVPSEAAAGAVTVSLHGAVDDLELFTQCIGVAADRGDYKGAVECLIDGQSAPPANPAAAENATIAVGLEGVEQYFITYRANDDSTFTPSDDFEATCEDFEDECRSRLDSSGEVNTFRRNMKALAKMVKRGQFLANGITCESEDSLIDVTFRPGAVECTIHKYVVDL